MPEQSEKAENRYKAIIERIFFDRYTKGATEIVWDRTEIESAADRLGIALPKNLGDVVYAIRYRTPLPESVLATQPEGMEWIIEGVARSRYAFRLVKLNRIDSPTFWCLGVSHNHPQIRRNPTGTSPSA